MFLLTLKRRKLFNVPKIGKIIKQLCYKIFTLKNEVLYILNSIYLYKCIYCPTTQFLASSLTKGFGKKK